MGRKAQGKKLEVLLDPGEQEQLSSICTIRMVQAEEMLRRFVLDGIKQETTSILQQHALAVQVSIDQATGKFVRRASEVNLDELDPPDLQGTLADQYPPGSSQAREKCEGTCSGKCTLAQDTTITDYAIWPEKGLRGGEADEESLQKKQGTPTADQYPEHSGHSQGTNTCSAEASDSSRPFERISTSTRALERIEDDEQFN